MEKEFSFEGTFRDYLNSYMRILVFGIPVLAVAVFRLSFHEYENMNLIIVGILIGYPILLLYGSFLGYDKAKNTKYIFSDDTIQVIVFGETKKYSLEKVKNVTVVNNKRKATTGYDHIRIQFKSGERITIKNAHPQFKEIKIFLEEYFKEHLGITFNQYR